VVTGRASGARQQNRLDRGPRPADRRSGGRATPGRPRPGPVQAEGRGRFPDLHCRAERGARPRHRPGRRAGAGRPLQRSRSA
jgi:hypothetical protein